MATKSAVDDFLAQKKIAVFGASRNKNKFGNTIYRDLKKKGFIVFAVNSSQEKIEGDPSYENLKALPEKVDGVVFVVPPEKTEQGVEEAVSLGIRRIWMQQGAESEKAVTFCKENGIDPVAKECILMFAEPVGFGHKIHRWIWKLFGKLPE